MTAPAFRSRWTDWTPGRFPGDTPETEPAKPSKQVSGGFEGAIPGTSPESRPPSVQLEGDGCTRCGSPLSDPGDLLCGGCYASRRGPARVLTFGPARRLRTIARLSARPCGNCGRVDWYVNPRGDATCRTCAVGRTASTGTGTDSVPGGGTA